MKETPLPDFDWSVMCDHGLCSLCLNSKECPDSWLYNPDPKGRICPDCGSDDIVVLHAPLSNLAIIRRIDYAIQAYAEVDPVSMFERLYILIDLLKKDDWDGD